MPLPLSTLLPALSDESFERFVRLARRQLGVPVALVSLVDAEEQVFPGAAGLPEPYQTTRRTPISHSFCQHVVLSREPLVVTDAREHPLVRESPAIADLGVVAYAGYPLVDADGRVIGSMCAIDGEPRSWTEDDLAVLADLAGAASSELQLRAIRERHARAAEVAGAEWHRTQQLLEERSGVAETLQRAMLTTLPDPPGLQIAARYLPAHALDQVGGDWYDAFGAGDDTVLVIGDTAGHDITAAADMSQLRTLLRAYAVDPAVDRTEPPSWTMRRLDRAVEQLDVGAVATVVLARIDQRAGAPARLRWTNAGHPPPVLLHEDGRVDVLATAPEMLIGADAGRPRTDHAVSLPPGSTLLLYTDGLIERRATGRSIDAGIEELVAQLRGQGACSLESVLDRLMVLLDDGREDDVALLAVRTDPA